jgi:hypothetical protein
MTQNPETLEVIAELLAAVDRQIAEAETDLVNATAGQSVCQLHKSGRVTGGLKYSEGKLVALKAIRRVLDQLHRGDLALAEVYQAFETNMAEQQQTFTRFEGKGTSATPWLAYASGELDAYETVREMLEQAGL